MREKAHMVTGWTLDGANILKTAKKEAGQTCGLMDKIV